MANGCDERCAADVANVVEGRRLSRKNAGWLARAVTGAIRPNRDLPLWDMAHAVVAIGAGADVKGLIDTVLDPRLVSPEAIERRLSPSVPQALRDERGIVLASRERQWRCSWSGLVRLLALAEFILTMEDLAAFGTVSGWFKEALAPPNDVDLLVSRLVSRINQYRQAHVPLAPIEKRFRAILVFLGGRRRGAGPGDSFDDDDILAFWHARIAAGERPQLTTIVDHFITFEKAARSLGNLRRVAGAVSLEDIEGWADRLDTVLGDVATPDDAAVTLTERLKDMPESPKILTGTERDDLLDVLALDPFHRTHPLTVLRAVSFGRVQSGIANRLRRGGGGAPISERVHCADARTYANVLARAQTLAAHLSRMIAIAAALRLDRAFDEGRVGAVLEAARQDAGRIRRAGFDDRDALKAAFAGVDEALVGAADELGGFMRAAGAPAKGRRPADRFEEDRIFFSAAFTDAYHVREDADGTG